jgi:hypothetical protein
MERSRVAFMDAARPERSGALVLDDDGRASLETSPALAAALAAGDAADLAPLRFDDLPRGLALAASLRRGVKASFLAFEFASGAFEVRASIDRASVRMTLKPGDFDPDVAWEFLVAANETRLAIASA